jgi:hypothetical protein
MSFPALTRLSISAPEDREKDRQLYDFLKTAEKVERAQDALTYWNLNKQAKRERVQERRQEIIDEIMEDIDRIDSEIRTKMAFMPLSDQECEIERARDNYSQEWEHAYDEGAVEYVINMKAYKELQKNLITNINHRRVKRRVFNLLEELPDDVKMIVLRQSIDAMGSWERICNFIQHLCSVSRLICETIWPFIASEILEIPMNKPVDMVWRSWVKEWCQKTSSCAPWGRTIDEMGHCNPISYEEAIWLLNHSPRNYLVSDLRYDYTVTSSDFPINSTWPSDKLWMMGAVWHDGRILSIGSYANRNDREIVRVACMTFPFAFESATDEVKRDGRFIRSFMFSQPDILKFISNKVDDLQLRKMKNLISTAISNAHLFYDFEDAPEDEEDDPFQVTLLKTVDACGSIRLVFDVRGETFVDKVVRP